MERITMGETCKTCRKEYDFGIWLVPQFSDEKVLLFCSSTCRDEYIQIKLARIKSNYPKYYEKLMASLESGKNDNSIDSKLKKMIGVGRGGR